MGRLLVRLSLARESWDRHRTGTWSSLAMIFRERLMSATTCWRFSPAYFVPLPEACMSWR